MKSFKKNKCKKNYNRLNKTKLTKNLKKVYFLSVK